MRIETDGEAHGETDGRHGAGTDDFPAVLRQAYEHAVNWRTSVGRRPAFPDVTHGELRGIVDLPGGLPARREDAATTLDVLARAGELGSTGSAGPRYFGYVIGSSLPVATAADWMVAAWDQNATLYSCGPAVSVIEEVCADWLVDLLGLPHSTSVGFTTGTQMATFICLAAARHHLLTAAGWDVGTDGLWQAPRVPVIVSEQRHASIDRALRLLGMGTRVHAVACDGQGAVDLSALERTLRHVEGTPIVCVQAGNINTGAVDPLAEVCERVHARGGWVHVDGAIGLWALASDEHRRLLEGACLADSLTTDAHKWLNVPFDCGMAFVAHPAAHKAAAGITADYLEESEYRDQIDTVPDWSRRARSVPVYAALRTLGRAGVGDLVDRNVGLARRMAVRLAAEPGIEIANDVVLNQVLVRFAAAPGCDPDEFTEEVISQVQREGTCWLSGTAFAGRRVMRVSVCSWLTTTQDVDRAAEAVIHCYRDCHRDVSRAAQRHNPTVRTVSPGSKP